MGSRSSRPRRLRRQCPRKSKDTDTRRRFARFEIFVVGMSNKVALTAAQSVAQRLGADIAVIRLRSHGFGKVSFAGSRLDEKPRRAAE